MKRIIAGIAILLLVSGCFRVLDSAVDSAGRSIGDSIGRSIGDSVGRSIESSIAQRLNPMLTTWYINSMFAVAFGAGGYTIGATEYEAGEWTRWTGLGDEEEGWMERAYLGDDDKGNQWWRVKFFDAEEDATFVLEGLFSNENGTLLRLRRLFPGDEAPSEMPVEKDTHFIPPRQLGEESIEGATLGKVKVTVPAGSFTTDHVRFGDAGGGTWEWWLSEDVPGGVVRYASRGADGSDKGSEEALDPARYDIRLLSYGSDAASELGVMD